MSLKQKLGKKAKCECCGKRTHRLYKKDEEAYAALMELYEQQPLIETLRVDIDERYD